MNYFKLLFLLILAGLSFVTVYAQGSGIQNITVAPSLYPDTITKPAVVEAGAAKSTAISEHAVRQEPGTVTPESKLSVGKASAVATPERENPVPSATTQETINYSEQKIEKQELPVNNPSLNPK